MIYQVKSFTMQFVNLRDNNFAGQEFSSRVFLKSTFTWDRSCSQTGPTVYTDEFLNNGIYKDQGIKIAWMLEPISVFPFIYHWIRKNFDLFEEVWTHDDEVLRKIPNSKFVPAAGCWIEEQNIKIGEKRHLCSYIASSMSETIGHKFRQKIRKVLPYGIPQFGRGYNEIPAKSMALIKYAYSIVVENVQRDTYFSEKIIDCFLTGTIPIYWGTKKIERYFDVNGIIYFDTIDELMSKLKKISFENYELRYNAILMNFELAKRFILPEEWGMNNYNYTLKNLSGLTV